MSLKIFLLGSMQKDFSFEAGNSFPVGLSDYLFNVKLTPMGTRGVPRVK